MKYFVDFEAQQFTNCIISVGCVREDGEKFYSLVKPNGDKKKITSFITDLTGITTEMVNNAPTTTEVFSNFFDWVSDDLNPEFYCYGDCDKLFVKATLSHATAFKEKLILNFLGEELIDYEKRVRKYFHACNGHGLKRVAEFFLGEEIVQTHNSLEDAEMLKCIYENTYEGSYDGEDPFVKPKENSDIQSNSGTFLVTRVDIEGNEKKYNSMGAALRDLGLVKYSVPKAKRMRKAARQEKLWYGYYWIVERTENL